MFYYHLPFLLSLSETPLLAHTFRFRPRRADEQSLILDQCLVQEADLAVRLVWLSSGETGSEKVNEGLIYRFCFSPLLAGIWPGCHSPRLCGVGPDPTPAPDALVDACIRACACGHLCACTLVHLLYIFACVCVCVASGGLPARV